MGEESYLQSERIGSLRSFLLINLLVEECFKNGIFSSGKYKDTASYVGSGCLTPLSWHTDSCMLFHLNAVFFNPVLCQCLTFLIARINNSIREDTGRLLYWCFRLLDRVCLPGLYVLMRKWRTSSQLLVTILLPKSAADWNPSADLLGGYLNS